MPTGGDLLEITCQHPTLGTYKFYPKSSEGSTYDLGGARSSSDKNMRDGSGAPIRKMNISNAGFKSKIGWDMNQRQDLENLNDLSNSPVNGTWTFSHINGTSYVLSNGYPVGDLVGEGNDATIDCEWAGEKMQLI